MSDEIIGRSFAVFGLVMFMAAYLVNRAALRLLDEAKAQADLWESRRDEAETLSREAITIYENTQRLRAGTVQALSGSDVSPAASEAP